MFDIFTLNLYGQLNSSEAPHQVNVNYNFKISMNFPNQYEVENTYQIYKANNFDDFICYYHAIRAQVIKLKNRINLKFKYNLLYNMFEIYSHLLSQVEAPLGLEHFEIRQQQKMNIN